MPSRPYEQEQQRESVEIPEGWGLRVGISAFAAWAMDGIVELRWMA